MAGSLEGKNALVTGGSRGIGKAIGLRLARAGCNVGVNYFVSADEARSVCEEMRQIGVEAFAARGDVKNPSSVEEMFSAVREHFDRLDFLIHNAASGVLKPVLEMTTKDWRWCLETNALSLNHVVQQGKDLLVEGSRVLVLSSLGAARAFPNYSYIGASKAALESLVRSLSLELAPSGVSVNTISAGLVDTDAIQHFPNRDQLVDEFRSRSLLGREIRAEEVADVAYLLCLPESAAIRGQTIVVDGGFSIVG